MRGLAVIGAVAFAASLAVGVPRAAAAETHSNCATFDNNGNITSVVPNCSETITSKGGLPQSMPGFDPCTGDTGTVTIYTTSSIFHVNVNGAGDVWVTGTQNGAITFTPDDPSAMSATGHWASWFGGAMNKQNAVLHDTFNAVLHLSGSSQTVSLHGLDHVTFTPAGTVTSSFSIPAIPTCG